MKRICWAGGLALGIGLAGATAAPLPPLDADLSQTTVSGLSSGAYMAGQFHVAFSDTIAGAALVAGGPYDCAEGSIAFALQRCMETNLGAPDPGRLAARAQARADRGEIDPLAGLAGDSVYLFSGTNDATVTPPVAATVDDFYRAVGVPANRIRVIDTMPAGHAFATEAVGNACATSTTPFINDCDYDQAGDILATFYTPLQPPAAAPTGRIVAFDQGEFLTDPTAHGLATTGFAYVPAACEAGGCRVHVVFHGCRQTESLVGRAVIEDVGYTRWADTNRLILLYPQTHATGSNPNACWDWWGYDDAAYATRNGRQMVAVRAMVDRLGAADAPVDGAFCARFEATNFSHWRAGRARLCDWWFLCAVGSGERLGLPVGTTTLFESPQGSFGTVSCTG